MGRLCERSEGIPYFRQVCLIFYFNSTINSIFKFIKTNGFFPENQRIHASAHSFVEFTPSLSNVLRTGF